MSSRVWTLGLAATAFACSSPEEPPGEARQALRDSPVVVYVVLDGPPATAMVEPGSDFGAPEAVKRTRARLAELAELHAQVRPALEARGARVTGELRRLANAFQVVVDERELPEIARLPQVLRIDPAPIHELHLGTALGVVGAPGAWSAPTPFHGEGQTIGILDSGIDYLHADFGGPGDPAVNEANDPLVIEPGTFPTTRVFGGVDLVGDTYNPTAGEVSPEPDPDPMDCRGHGSHVAGIAGGGGVLQSGASYNGPYDLSFDPRAFKVAPGIAPRVRLYAIKIFGCQGSTQVVANGLELAVDPDEDGDFSDRLDVVNASLGSPYGTADPTQEEVVGNYTAAGGLFVASSGNEGNSFFLTGSPACYSQALAVAATVDVPLVKLRVDAPSGLSGSYAASEAYFSAQLAEIGPLSGEVVMAEPPLACDGLDNPDAARGKIVLADRGGCFFYDKFVSAAAAGAIGVVVANNDYGDPFPMSPPPGGGQSELPGVMIRNADADLIKQTLASGVAVTLTNERYAGLGAELMAGFSSRGPSTAGLIKPDMAAPGQDIGSVATGSGTEGVDFNGTSMASPMVAGSAVLLRQASPGLDPLGVKATLMNSATSLIDPEGLAYPLSLQGNGRVDVARAVRQQVFAHATVGSAAPGEVGVSFGAVTSFAPVVVERQVTLENGGLEAATFSAAALVQHPLPGVTLAVTPDTVIVQPGGATEVTLALALDPAALADPPADPATPASQGALPRHALDEVAGQLWFVDQAGLQTLSVPFHAAVRAASDLHAAAPAGCVLASGDEVAAVALVGASAHPDPVVSAFELGALRDSNQFIDPAVDVLAVGVATDLPLRGSVADAVVHFGVAVTGEWSTPALGDRSIVAIAIDIDEDAAPDFTIRAEPLNRDNGYADVLVATVYDQSTCLGVLSGDCAQVGSKQFLDLVPASDADTNPYFNGVLAFSAYAADIGLTDADTRFSYAAYSAGFFAAAAQTPWARFDAASPRVDPARDAPTPGVPLYRQDEPVLVRLARDETGVVPSLLLLHHSGEAGKRFELLDVGSYGADPVVLGHTLPAAVHPGERIAGQLTVDNLGDTPVHGLTLRGHIDDGVRVLFAPSHGSCADGADLACDLGTLLPGARHTVGVQIDAAAPTAHLALTLASASGCEQPLAIDVAVAGDEPLPPRELAGGCSCEIGAGPPPGATGPSRPWLLLLLLAQAARTSACSRRFFSFARAQFCSWRTRSRDSR